MLKDLTVSSDPLQLLQCLLSLFGFFERCFLGVGYDGKNRAVERGRTAFSSLDLFLFFRDSGSYLSSRLDPHADTDLRQHHLRHCDRPLRIYGGPCLGELYFWPHSGSREERFSSLRDP